MLFFHVLVLTLSPAPDVTVIFISVRVFGPNPAFVDGAPPVTVWSGSPVK
jgi:hypothetical protein